MNGKGSITETPPGCLNSQTDQDCLVPRGWVLAPHEINSLIYFGSGSKSGPPYTVETEKSAIYMHVYFNSGTEVLGAFSMKLNYDKSKCNKVVTIVPWQSEQFAVSHNGAIIIQGNNDKHSKSFGENIELALIYFQKNGDEVAQFNLDGVIAETLNTEGKILGVSDRKIVAGKLGSNPINNRRRRALAGRPTIVALQPNALRQFFLYPQN